MDTKDGDDTNTIASVQLTETRDVLQQRSISKSNQGETIEKVQSISQANNEDDKKDINLETPPPPSDEAKPKTRSRRIFERVRFVLLVIGIILSMFMISLNSTVVAPAMNIIATELDAVAQQTWIATSYLVAMNSFQGLAGKVLGSIVNSTTPSINGLIAGRTVQGSGAGCVISMLFVIVTDIVPLHLRPRFQSMLTVIYGLSSVIGPLMGGAFVDHVTWRWDFWINVIIGGCTTVILTFLFKEPAKVTKSSLWVKFKRIDFLGTLFSIGLICCLLLALNFGDQFGWNTPHAYGPFIGAAISLIMLITSQGWISHEPLMPRQVVLNPAIFVVYLYMMCLGLSFIGTLYFGPILFQAVFGASSTSSGIRLIPYMALLIVGSVGSGFLLPRFRRLKYYLMFGAASNLLGYGLFFTVNENSNWGQQACYLTFCGLAFGLSQQNAILAVQQVAPKEYIAIATTLVNFFMMLASSVGIAIFQTLYVTFLQGQASGLDPDVMALAQKYGALENYLYIRDMPTEAQLPVIQCYMRALHTVFILPLAVAGLGLICTFFIKDVRFMGQGVAKPKDEEQGNTVAEKDHEDDAKDMDNASVVVQPEDKQQQSFSTPKDEEEHGECQTTIR
ncbi:family drug resistance transporter [Lichtheimia corymbifera JMRC:FSU:9682]|uniref:Family drug resistance transporter n=1 Tax=Lichtheimia corymbifera JMRC:FSU:9682 TaxID=1263082 RepID=A0A068SAD1_9FUNG|nr:family drug resistance transporter [Lichtheimia corymbifera JMRC:FSU:9682]